MLAMYQKGVSTGGSVTQNQTFSDPTPVAPGPSQLVQNMMFAADADNFDGPKQENQKEEESNSDISEEDAGHLNVEENDDVEEEVEKKKKKKSKTQKGDGSKEMLNKKKKVDVFDDLVSGLANATKGI